MNETVFLIFLFVVAAAFLAFLFFADKALKEERAENAIRLKDAPEHVLATVDEIRNDIYYIGKESYIVKSKMNSTENKHVFFFECICKTTSGLWFLLEFNYEPRFKGIDHPIYKDVIYKKVNPIDLSIAKSMLAQDIEIYKSHFGIPEAA